MKVFLEPRELKKLKENINKEYPDSGQAYLEELNNVHAKGVRDAINGKVNTFWDLHDVEDMKIFYRKGLEKGKELIKEIKKEFEQTKILKNGYDSFERKDVKLNEKCKELTSMLKKTFECYEEKEGSICFGFNRKDMLFFAVPVYPNGQTIMNPSYGNTRLECVEGLMDWVKVIEFQEKKKKEEKKEPG